MSTTNNEGTSIAIPPAFAEAIEAAHEEAKGAVRDLAALLLQPNIAAAQAKAEGARTRLDQIGRRTAAAMGLDLNAKRYVLNLDRMVFEEKNVDAR
jgi:predicted metalloprotease